MNKMDIQDSRTRLKEELSQFIGTQGEATGEKQFESLALRLFRYQYHHIPAYRRMCQFRHTTPETVTHWLQIPPVSTAIYKQMTLFAGPEDHIAHTFSTSGTTKNRKRGQANFSTQGLQLMKHAILANAGQMLFPDAPSIHIYVLAPPPHLAPYMIMSWGMDCIIRHFGSPRSAFLFNQQGLDRKLLEQNLTHAVETGEPVALIGASFGFVNLLEQFKAEGISYRLPPGSRIMDAGGYKGRSRVLTREELESWFHERLGIPPRYAVNLLGMTEMASQIYDDTISATFSGLSPTKLKQNPFWVHSRLVVPFTLKEIPAGQEGVLCHLDLANLDTPMCVLTDDLGTMEHPSRRFHIRGRVSSDLSRGCSLTIEELSMSKGVNR